MRLVLGRERTYLYPGFAAFMVGSRMVSIEDILSICSCAREILRYAWLLWTAIVAAYQAKRSPSLRT